MPRFIIYIVVYVFVVGPVVALLLKWVGFRYNCWQASFFRALSIMVLYHFVVASFRSAAETAICFMLIFLFDKVLAAYRNKKENPEEKNRDEKPGPPEG